MGASPDLSDSRWLRYLRAQHGPFATRSDGRSGKGDETVRENLLNKILFVFKTLVEQIAANNKIHAHANKLPDPTPLPDTWEELLEEPSSIDDLEK